MIGPKSLKAGALTMNEHMKRFLMSHGLTALDVAQKAGMEVQSDIYAMLSGRKEPSYELRSTLQNVYGMTDAEYAAAIPKGGTTCTR